jgi:transketolase
MKATRDGFGEGLVDIGSKNSDIVVLSADLSKATRTAKFAKEYPDRFFECGIAECNAIGIASGLSENGFYPVFSSFASFLTGKYDVIRVSACYSNATMLLVGTHAGLAIGKDGVTQMGLEDVSLMRAIPNMKVFQPATSNQTVQMLREIVKTTGPSYLRIGRQPVPECFSTHEDISLGEAQIISDDGESDICFVTSGCILHDVIEAASFLRSRNKKISILNFHTIKPFDNITLEKFAKRSSLIVSVEDHSTSGGLGSLVCESLSQSYPSRVLRIGLDDVFPESAPPKDLYKKYGLDSDGIVSKIEKFIKR